jgi:hypothetical protein
MVFSLRLIMVMVMVLSLAKGKTFAIRVVASSQGLLPEITNTDVSFDENRSTDIPLLTIAHGKTDKSIQYSISLWG